VREAASDAGLLRVVGAGAEAGWAGAAALGAAALGAAEGAGAAGAGAAALGAGAAAGAADVAVEAAYQVWTPLCPRQAPSFLAALV